MRTEHASLAYWLDSGAIDVAAEYLDDGDDFACWLMPRETARLREHLEPRGLTVIVDATDGGRAYVMTRAEAAKVGPAGPAYGSHPLEELSGCHDMPAKFADFGDDEEPTTVDIRLPGGAQ